MPIDPNHIHADTPHAKTVHLASQGWRYGCSSVVTGDDAPRGGQTRYTAHPWSANAGRLIVTDWLPRSCGTTYAPVMGPCAGCTNNTHHPPA